VYGDIAARIHFDSGYWRTRFVFGDGERGLFMDGD